MNKILNDNCINVLKEMEDDSVDLIVTDPPYVLDKTGGRGSDFGNDLAYHDEINKMSDGFDLNVFDEMLRVMKKVNIYIFCSQKQLPTLIDYFVKKHGCNWNLLTWHKTNPVPACGNKYLSDTEYCFFAREKGVKIHGSYNTKKTYYVTPSNVKEKRKYGHPTIKPLEIVHNLINNSSVENDVVLDPFMGSGTTGVASNQLNRKFIGVEINDEYFDIADKRITDSKNT